MNTVHSHSALDYFVTVELSQDATSFNGEWPSGLLCPAVPRCVASESARVCSISLHRQWFRMQLALLPDNGFDNRQLRGGLLVLPQAVRGQGLRTASAPQIAAFNLYREFARPTCPEP